MHQLFTARSEIVRTKALEAGRVDLDPEARDGRHDRPAPVMPLPCDQRELT
jgi:hypothetical protein